MEKYAERLVKGRVGSDAFLIMGIGGALMVAGIAITILLTSFGLFLVLIGGFICSQAVSRFKVEFEYLILDGDIDVAKIYAKKSRKNIRSISAEEIQYMAPMSNDRARNDLEVKRQLKIYDYTEKSSDTSNYYIVFENHNGKESAYILDLEGKSLDLMKEALKAKFRK